jgi:hypothetical protein
MPATILGFLLLLLHFLLGDRVAGLAVVYYLTPLPLIGLLFLPLLFRSIRRKKALPAIAAALLALAPAALHFKPLYFPRTTIESPAGKERLKVVFWTPDNYGATTVDEGFLYLSGLDFDIIALVEGNVDHGRQEALAKVHFPHHTMELLDHGMLLIHNGKLLDRSSRFVDGNRGGLQQCSLEWKGHTLALALYDQDSSPFYSRKASLQELSHHLLQVEGPLLLMGDFNLPHTAPSLNSLDRFLDPIFPHVDQGSPFTWPEPAPFMAIDQVWFTWELQPVDVAVQRTGLAQHRLLRMEFGIAPAADPAAK